MQVTVLYNQGSLFTLNDEQKITDEDTYKMAYEVSEVLSSCGYNTKLLKITPNDLSSIDYIDSDLVFNICEWTGRDYLLSVKVIDMLAQKGLSYTGADAKSYEWGSNKILMKKLFDKCNIPSPRFIIVEDKIQKVHLEKLSRFNYPLIMKPSLEHCGIGIRDSSIVYSLDDLMNKVEGYYQEYNQPIIVEEFIDGREFQVTLLKNGVIKTLPLAEIIFADKPGRAKIYSFGSKWEKSPEESVFADTLILREDSEIAQKIKNLSELTFKKLGCRGYARMDIRAKNDEIYVLEVNVNPGLDPDPEYGMTASSLAFGWDFKDLILEIAKAGLEK